MRCVIEWLYGLWRAAWCRRTATWDPYSEPQDDMTVIPPALRRKANG